MHEQVLAGEQPAGAHREKHRCEDQLVDAREEGGEAGVLEEHLMQLSQLLLGEQARGFVAVKDGVSVTVVEAGVEYICKIEGAFEEEREMEGFIIRKDKRNI